MSLAISESKVPGTDRARLHAGVQAHAGARGRVERASPGRASGRKPRPTSSALMRNSNAWPRGAGVSVTDSGRPSATRSCSITRSMPVVSSVTGCSTCRRVLTSRNEIAPPVAEQELHRAGARRSPRRRRCRARLRGCAARCASVRNGAGASSTSFWLRRCSEQSRVPSTTTLPCVSAMHLRLDVARPVEELLDEAFAAAEGGDGLAHGRRRTARPPRPCATRPSCRARRRRKRP